MKTNRVLMSAAVATAIGMLAGCNVKVGAPDAGTVGSGQYKLGGSIAGLSGANLELSDEFGSTPNTVTPASGATSFSFLGGTGYLAVGNIYDVTAVQQPLGQRCSIANASGTVQGQVLASNGSVLSSGNITNVQVTCVSPTINTVLSASNYQSATSGESVNGATSLAIAADGTVYAVDHDTGVLLNITQPSTASIVALKTSAGASIANPHLQQIAIDSAGNLYAAAGTTGAGAVIEQITRAGVVTVLAGSGAEGSADGTATAASFGNQVQGLAVDSNGNLYIADYDSNAATSRLRKLVISTGVVTTLAGAGTAGSANGSGSAASFDFSGIRGNMLAVDNMGTVYAVETVNDDVRKITAAGVVTTLAGSPTAPGTADSVSGTAGAFQSPRAIAAITLNSVVGVYVLDGDGYVRMVLPNGNVSTLVGAGVPMIGSNGAVATTGGLGNASCLSADAAGNLYSTTYGSNSSVLEVTFG